MQSNGGSAPTGCYKCGRPGHWSRDCPFSPVSSSDPTSNSKPSSNPNPKSSNFSRPTYNSGAPKPIEKSEKEKPQKPPRTRPKLTPELLLSNDGLGYVLRHFPRTFKYRGRGHEVSDLGNLIGLYAEWHSHLLPYYSFDQFVKKVERVGATNRVRTCIRELRARVERGGDPTRLHETPVENVAPDCEPETEEGTESSVPNVDAPTIESHDAVDVQEEMLNEIYIKATEEPHQSSQSEMVTDEALPQRSPVQVPPFPVADSIASNSNKVELSEEQKARMEANRRKALKRMAARSCSSQAA